MSSYHELMVDQARSDRNRLLTPRMSAGAAHEVSAAEVRQHLAQRRADALEARLHGIGRMVATVYRSITSAMRQARPAAR